MVWRRDRSLWMKRKTPAEFQQVSRLAGATRVELVSTVLETAVLPLNYAPLFNARISYRILRTMSREKVKFLEKYLYLW